MQLPPGKKKKKWKKKICVIRFKVLLKITCGEIDNRTGFAEHEVCIANKFF